MTRELQDGPGTQGQGEFDRPALEAAGAGGRPAADRPDRGDPAHLGPALTLVPACLRSPRRLPFNAQGLFHDPELDAA